MKTFVKLLLMNKKIIVLALFLFIFALILRVSQPLTNFFWGYDPLAHFQLSESLEKNVINLSDYNLSSYLRWPGLHITLIAVSEVSSLSLFSLIKYFVPVLSSLGGIVYFISIWKISKNKVVALLAAFILMVYGDFVFQSSQSIPESFNYFFIPLILLSYYYWVNSKKLSFLIITFLIFTSSVIIHHLSSLFITLMLLAFTMSGFLTKKISLKWLIINGFAFCFIWALQMSQVSSVFFQTIKILPEYMDAYAIFLIPLSWLVLACFISYKRKLFEKEIVISHKLGIALMFVSIIALLALVAILPELSQFVGVAHSFLPERFLYHLTLITMIVLSFTFYLFYSPITLKDPFFVWLFLNSIIMVISFFSSIGTFLIPLRTLTLSSFCFALISAMALYKINIRGKNFFILIILLLFGLSSYFVAFPNPIYNHQKYSFDTIEANVANWASKYASNSSYIASDARMSYLINSYGGKDTWIWATRLFLSTSFNPQEGWKNFIKDFTLHYPNTAGIEYIVWTKSLLSLGVTGLPYKDFPNPPTIDALNKYNNSWFDKIYVNNENWIYKVTF